MKFHEWADEKHIVGVNALAIARVAWDAGWDAGRWCPGVAEKLGPMTPKEAQQVADGVVARYFPHLANETIAELTDHLVRVVMDSFNDDGSVNEYRLRQTFGDVLCEEMAK
jgi:hypothetical protein